MVREGRFFICDNCGIGVWICKSCDRGHRYCSRKCSHEARRKTWKKSGRKFRGTEAGRKGNARRQRDSYDRKKSLKNSENLTHQGSVEPQPPSIILTQKAAETPFAPRMEKSLEPRSIQRTSLTGTTARLAVGTEDRPNLRRLPRCHFCGCPCCEDPTIFDLGGS